MGKTVISIPVISLSVKAVRGIRAVRRVMESLKVVFRQPSQNETSLGGVSVTKPLITRIPACCLNMRHYPILRQHFTIADYIALISDKVWIYRCPTPVLHRGYYCPSL